MNRKGRYALCRQCGNEFYLARWQEIRSNGRNFCSHRCHSLSLLKPRVEVTCRQCGVKFLDRPKNIDKGKGIFCSKKCSLIVAVQKASIRNKGADETTHGQWKGDKVGYFGVHDWMTKHYGQPIGCEVCKTIDPQRTYGWANLSHEYKRNRKDFKRMCMSCHRKYDGAGKKAWATFLKRKALSAA